MVHDPGWLWEEEKVATRGTKTMAKLNAGLDNTTSHSITQFLKFSDYQRLIIAHPRRQPEAFRGRGYSVSNSFSSTQNIMYVYTHTHILVPGKGNHRTNGTECQQLITLGEGYSGAPHTTFRHLKLC